MDRRRVCDDAERGAGDACVNAGGGTGLIGVLFEVLELERKDDALVGMS